MEDRPKIYPEKNQAFWHNLFSVLFLFSIALALLILYAVSGLPKNIPAFDFLLLSLATYRLVRLFTYDSVTEHFREYLKKFERGLGRELFELFDCPWCVGVWMAFLLSFFYFISPLAFFPIVILAAAGAGSFIQITILKIGKDL
jgi:hypothetical protein